jgi:hypothetical protein
MKKALAFAAAAACCLSTAAVADLGWNPDLDEAIVINGGEAFSLGTNQSIVFTVQIAPNDNHVIGFSFAGVWTGGAGAWASDTRLTIVAPDGSTVARGGYPAPGNPAEWWDFQGGQSAPNGVYAHGQGGEQWSGDGQPDWAFDKIEKGGTWTFTFLNTYGTATWKGVVIVLHKQAVPAPGALALLGVAGLAAGRRRRRA